MFRTLGLHAVVLLLGAGLLVGVHAQTSTVGSISGTVRDPQGAAVNNAQVVIQEKTTGQSRTLTTDDEGRYSAQKLAIGQYTVTATAPGFKTFQQTAVDLHVNDDLAININLEIGNITDTVSVVGAPLVETTNGGQSSLISEKQVTELPLNGRNFAALALNVPGVSPGQLKAGGTGLDSNVDLSANGAGSAENMWTIDGVNNLDVGSNQTLLTFPSIDSIAEFKVERNNFGVEFGGAQGIVVNVVTKGGANQFHGSAWEFFRNDKLNANDWANNRAGVARPALRYNNPGFNFSGPIKKNKIFFWWSEEWRFESRALTQEDHAPTAAEKLGDFSGVLTGPLPHQPGQTCTTPGPSPTDPGCFPGNKIPQSQLSPFGLAFVKLYADANNLADPLGTNFTRATSSPIRTRQDLIRGDWNINSNASLMVRYINERWTRGAPADTWGEDAFPAVDSNWAQPSKSLAVKLTNTLSSTAVNEFQFSRSGNDIATTQAGDTALIEEINSKFPTVFPISRPGQSHPVDWGGGGYPALWSHAPWQNTEDLFVWKDDFSKVMGAHTLKIGALFSHNKKEEPAYCVDGDDRQLSIGDTTGNHIAEILLKDTLLPGYNEFDHREVVKLRWRDFEVYAGDTWKMKRNVTLTYGMRYSRFGNAYSANNRITNFIPRLFDGIDPASALVQPDLKGFNRSVVEQYKKGFQPRIGIAWDVKGDGKTAIRGGIGRYQSRTNIGRWLALGLNPPWTNNLFAGDLRTLDSVPASLQNLPLGVDCTVVTCNFNAVSEKFPPPESWQWNLTLSREIFRDTSIEVSYVGTHGIHLWRRLNYNDVIPNTNILRLPGVGNVRMDEQTGNSRYNSLQVWLNRRFARGLTYQVAYTFGHSTSDVALEAFDNVVTDPFDYTKDQGNSDLDRRHMLVGTMVYEIPGPKSLGSAGRAIFGGWQTSLVASFLSGVPLDITTGNSLVGFTNVQIQRPDLVPGQTIYLKQGIQYLNHAAFADPAPGTFGNLKKGSIIGPGSQVWDFSMARRFALNERMNLQFRFEAFNLFNHPIFNFVENNLSNGDFGQLSTTGRFYRKTARDIQLGLKFQF